MATSGDVSGLKTLQYGGVPLVPLVSGFSRIRRSGVIQSETMGGTTRQRKNQFYASHVANVSFYLRSVYMQDYMQSFINVTEGSKFICYLSADNSDVEPYVVQAIENWNHNYVSAIDGSVNCKFEIFSTEV